MTVLLACWLFMAKSTPRDVLVLGCAVVLGLDLECGWILSIPKQMIDVLLLWTLCVVTLALPVPTAAWRLVVGLAGTVGLVAYGLYYLTNRSALIQSNAT